MKNPYLTSYFPLLSIILFSLALSLRTEMELISILKNAGIYDGMLEFFTDTGIKLSLLALLMVVYFMVFAAMKLIADTINEVSLLFFSKDHEGESLYLIRHGATIYFVGSIVSLLSFYSFIGIMAIFAVATMVYFIYFVYKISPKLTMAGLIGIVFFQVILWSTLVLGIIYLAVKVYNSILASLPI
ncbi:YufK family protein [Bacillus sp. ISL-55]|uniref:YufK family protein n=1 Tax=Bacillus sp. ISL-55 TaxID=2819134 RepID=UPI001BE7209C|nr:YufK family protein [Bacillus sp. ISL-55]MBT2694933.1 YufK family protein [Bacillus sp. ISL-55]